jgi:8-oxo-dGTP pyrophosphatase MutT (NUDIX family)
MYEVFLNDRKIVIADENEVSIYNEFVFNGSCNDLTFIDQKVSGFLHGNENQLVLPGNIDFVWNSFRQLFKLLPAAGGVVHQVQEFLFIFRKGKWDLPKGKQESGETPEMTALREVGEETGLHDLIVDGIFPSTWHLYQSPYKGSKGEWILKETAWFSMRGSENGILVPQTAEEIELVRWISKDELNIVLDNTYSSLKKIILSLR